jgi:hypothetical protein
MNKAGRLTILTKKEPVSELALEVFQRCVADKVAVLTVLQGPVGPAGTVKGVVLHGNNVHGGGG